MQTKGMGIRRERGQTEVVNRINDTLQYVNAIYQLDIHMKWTEMVWYDVTIRARKYWLLDTFCDFVQFDKQQFDSRNSLTTDVCVCDDFEGLHEIH